MARGPAAAVVGGTGLLGFTSTCRSSLLFAAKPPRQTSEPQFAEPSPPLPTIFCRTCARSRGILDSCLGALNGYPWPTKIPTRFFVAHLLALLVARLCKTPGCRAYLGMALCRANETLPVVVQPEICSIKDLLQIGPIVITRY